MGYALPINLHFFEAHFKVHYTKGFRLTYPIPLPTTVAGMFGSMLGVERSELLNEFRNYKFGACILNAPQESIDNYTYVQYGVNRVGVTKMHIMVEPKYVIVIANSDISMLKSIKDKLDNEIYYLPFGGQNDFFVKDWEVLDIIETSLSAKISNYLPADYYYGIEEDTTVEILPVKHKISNNENFYFVLNGTIKSKKEIEISKVYDKNIALYPLDNFYLLGDEILGVGGS